MEKNSKKKFKQINLLLTMALISLVIFGCSTSDPEPVNEEELITTVNVTFTNTQNANDVVIASFVDQDGPGGNDGITTNPTLTANATYTVQIEFLNESVSPTEDITEEVKEEGDDHQVFYVISSSLNIGVAYNDEDANNLPIGLNCTFTVGAAGTGTMETILVHLPVKTNAGVSEGDITNAGGDEDIHISFDVTVQ
jgi:hypothetical protein